VKVGKEGRNIFGLFGYIDSGYQDEVYVIVSELNRISFPRLVL